MCVKSEALSYGETTGDAGVHRLLSGWNMYLHTDHKINLRQMCKLYTNLKGTRAVKYVQRNIEAYSRNNCCCGKAVSLTYFCVCVCTNACVWV